MANPQPSDTGSKASKGFLWLWALLTFIWVAMNSSFAIEPLLTGAAISAAIAYYFTKDVSVWQAVRYSPSRLYHFIAYTGVFVFELVRANIIMMRYVYARRIDIHPGIVEIKTKLTSPMGRLTLVNSIALTPGSLVVDLDGDTLFIHWLDVKTTDVGEATRAIAGPFEDHLEKCFG
jgi:multicomponent Na+:H+ antiporter subunit E